MQSQGKATPGKGKSKAPRPEPAWGGVPGADRVRCWLRTSRVGSPRSRRGPVLVQDQQGGGAGEGAGPGLGAERSGRSRASLLCAGRSLQTWVHRSFRPPRGSARREATAARTGTWSRRADGHREDRGSESETRRDAGPAWADAGFAGPARARLMGRREAEGPRATPGGEVGARSRPGRAALHLRHRLAGPGRPPHAPSLPPQPPGRAPRCHRSGPPPSPTECDAVGRGLVARTLTRANGSAERKRRRGSRTEDARTGVTGRDRHNRDVLLARWGPRTPSQGQV